MPNADAERRAREAVDAKPLNEIHQTRVALVVSYETGADAITAILDNGARITAKLVAAADGRNSMAREHAGIKTSSWSYPQTAFVTIFAHQRPHEDMSTEFHTETGPCTQVPLPGNRSSLVWAVRPETGGITQGHG